MIPPFFGPKQKGYTGPLEQEKCPVCFPNTQHRDFLLEVEIMYLLLLELVTFLLLSKTELSNFLEIK